jgi:hypothetical protein
MRESARNEPVAAVVPIPPPAELLAPTFAAGGESGCWPWDLSESLKAGEALGEQLVEIVSSCLAAALEGVDVPKLVIDAPAAKGRLGLRPD